MMQRTRALLAAYREVGKVGKIDRLALGGLSLQVLLEQVRVQEEALRLGRERRHRNVERRRVEAVDDEPLQLPSIDAGPAAHVRQLGANLFVRNVRLQLSVHHHRVVDLHLADIRRAVWQRHLDAEVEVAVPHRRRIEVPTRGAGGGEG